MSQPSGWFDDPQDPSRLRYFDGILWTDRVVPRESPSAAASTIGRTPDLGSFTHWGQGQWSPSAGGPGGPGAPAGAGDPVDQGSVGPGGHGAPPAQGYGAGPAGWGPAPTMAWAPLGPTTPDGRPLAEWWQRLLASIIDGLVVGLVSFLCAAYWWFPIIQSYVELIGRLARSNTTDTRAIEAWSQQLAAAMLPITLVSLLVSVAIRVFCHSRWGATPGKRALGIRVRRTGRPGPLTVPEALRREGVSIAVSLVGLVPFIGLIGSLISLLDSLWLLWDPRRQTLHDKLADTLVERKPPQLR